MNSAVAIEVNYHYEDFDYSSVKVDDKILALKAQQGCEKSAEELIMRYKNYIRYLCRSFYVTDLEFDDLLQEGLLAAYKAIFTYNPNKDSFKGYVALAVNAKMKTLVKQSNTIKRKMIQESIRLERGHIFKDGKIRPFIEIIKDEKQKTPEEIMIEVEESQRVNRDVHGLKNLTKMEMEVFREFIKGKTYAEISLATGYKHRSIDNALQRIKRKLADYYKKQKEV